MRVAVKEIEIVGYPVQISSHDYMRNAFNFNICFIVKRGSSSQYESMVKKVAMTFESLERQNGFLQSPNILVCAYFYFLHSPQCEKYLPKSIKNFVKKTVVTFGSTLPHDFFSFLSLQTLLSPILHTLFHFSMSFSIAERLRSSLSPASHRIDFESSPRHSDVRSSDSSPPRVLANSSRHRWSSLRLSLRAANRFGSHAAAALSLVFATSEGHRPHRSLRCV